MKFEYKKIIDEVCSKDFLRRVIIMIIGAFILAVNYNLFLLHNNLVTGGTSGLAIIVNHYTGLSSATFLFLINVVFMVLSFILLGARRTGMTLIGAVLYPLFVSLTSGFCEYLATKIILDDFILIAIISGLLFGTANGFIYKTGFTTGGSDIPIHIINKYLKIPTGTASLAVNSIVIASGAMIFGISKAIYAAIILVINSFLIDKIMLGISDSKMFFIQTKKPDEIIKFIKSMNNGCTIMKAEGGHSNENNDIIMSVLSTKDYYMFKNVIEKIDPQAFFIISDCYEVHGGRRREKFPFI